MLMIAAAALGIQSSAIQRFGVPGLSSTYLVTGAAVGALVVMHLPWLSPILLVIPLASVVTLSTRLRRNEAGKEVDRTLQSRKTGSS